MNSNILIWTGYVAAIIGGYILGKHATDNNNQEPERGENHETNKRALPPTEPNTNPTGGKEEREDTGHEKDGKDGQDEKDDKNES